MLKTFDLDGYRIQAGGKVAACAERGEPYEAKLLADIADLGVSGWAVDVGAHIGNHSLWLAAHGFRVLAFEPDPASFALLRTNIDLNPDLVVYAFPIALGQHRTVAKFVAPGTLKLHRGDTEVVPYDDPIGGVFQPIAVVKIDVEGMEPQVLAGMTEMLDRDGPTVYTEAHGRPAERSHGAILEPLGYHKTRDIQMGSRMVKWAR